VGENLRGQIFILDKYASHRRATREMTVNASPVRSFRGLFGKGIADGDILDLLFVRKVF